MLLAWPALAPMALAAVSVQVWVPVPVPVAVHPWTGQMAPTADDSVKWGAMETWSHVMTTNASASG